MIDTIVLRIHGYEKYSHIVKYVEQLNSNNYVKKFNHPELQSVDKTSLLYGDTGNVLTLSNRTAINIASSHYTISTLLSKERDFIEFNMSIPKYLDDVEINRLDLCFNQFFLSKGDALRYLDEQRQLNLEYARSEKNRFQSYGSTTVQYVTDNYSFKIYHKGTEFRKNDLNQLLKNNPKNYKLGELSEVADKILRYEITCRKGLMNYIMKNRLKDDENTMLNHNLTTLQKLRNKASRDLIKSTSNKLHINATSKNPIDIFIHKTFPGKSFKFCLSSLWELPVQKPIDLLYNYNMCFNYELFECLHDFFMERVERYQLGVKMGITEIYGKIKAFQDEKDLKNKLYGKNEKVAQTGQLLLIAALSQYTDISDLKTVLPKATYYRYIKKMQELGIPKHSPDIAVNPPPLDYQTYFYYFGNNHILFN